MLVFIIASVSNNVMHQNYLISEQMLHVLMFAVAITINII